MQTLILLGSPSDKKITEKGLEILKELHISFDLRIASAHRSPELVSDLVRDFDAQGGESCICVAGKSAHLAGVVAAHTLRPVIGVPVFTPETAGFDALLSMGQMPKGIPVATMGLGSSGFINACLFTASIIAVKQEDTMEALQRFRARQLQEVMEADEKNRIEYRPFEIN